MKRTTYQRARRARTTHQRARRAFAGLATMTVLTTAALTTVPQEVCTTDLHCAQMHGVDLYGNPYPQEEN